MFERFTADARRAVVLAQEEARMLNHNYIGTEHLLLSLTKDRSIAGQALADTGITHAAALEHITELIGEGLAPVSGHIPFLPAARTVLLNATRSALAQGVNHVDSGHLLHSLLTDDTSSVPVAEHAIIGCGVELEAVRHRITELMTDPDAPQAEPESGFVLSA